MKRSTATRWLAEQENDHAMAVALFCGALAGALDTYRPGPDGASVVDSRIRELIALHISGDQLVIVALRDLVEERCLTTDHGTWAPDELRQQWNETGPHEHRWWPVAFDSQCTCGLFEHEFTEHGPLVEVEVDSLRRTLRYPFMGRAPTPRIALPTPAPPRET